VSDSATVTPLLDRWSALRASHGQRYLRDEAAALNVTEAELLVATRGAEARRLRSDDIAALLEAMAALGPWRTMSRNEHAVIEETGEYRELAFHGRAAQTVGDLELRIFPTRWINVYAVPVTRGDAVRGSIQVFDRWGHSVHKAFTENLDGWRGLADRFAAAPDDALAIDATPLPADRPDAEIDVATLKARWDALGHSHEFHGLLGDLRVGRLQALRLAGTGRARPVPVASLEQVLTAAHGDRRTIMIFVGNQGIVHIHVGPVNNVFRRDGWLNILENGFNLHVDDARITTAWVVTKPSTDGPIPSLECYDAEGRTVIQLFGYRHDGEPAPAAWTAVLTSLPTQS
jgi:putative hemin transport protein